MSELFNLPETPSPRLAWMRANKIQCHVTTQCPLPVSCWSGDLAESMENNLIGYGNTEDEAIADFAKRAGLRLWNEVGV